MKITAETKSFVSAIQWTLKSFDSRDDKAFVALEVTEGGTASLSHSNATSYMKSNFQLLTSDLDGEEIVTIPLQGQFLQRLMGALSSASTCELNYDDNSLHLKNGAGKFTVPTFKAKISAEPELSELGSVDNVLFFDSLQRLSKLCDAASAGLFPALGVVDIKIDSDNEKIVLMATDRYALGEVVLDFTVGDQLEDLGDKTNLLLPVEYSTLIPPSKGEDSTTQLVFEPKLGKLGYKFTDGRIALFALKEVAPIAYAQLKDSADNNTNSVDVDTKLLQKAIAGISTLAWNETEVFMKITKDNVTISDENGTNDLAVEIDNSDFDDDVSVKFKRTVINDAFSPIATSKVRLKWADEIRSFVFQPLLDSGDPADNVFVLATIAIS